VELNTPLARHWLQILQLGRLSTQVRLKRLITPSRPSPLKQFLCTPSPKDWAPLVKHPLVVTHKRCPKKFPANRPPSHWYTRYEPWLYKSRVSHREVYHHRSGHLEGTRCHRSTHMQSRVCLRANQSKYFPFTLYYRSLVDSDSFLPPATHRALSMERSIHMGCSQEVNWNKNSWWRVERRKGLESNTPGQESRARDSTGHRKLRKNQ
jgi:hypothetical protein